MSAKVFAESEWRKISHCASEVDLIRAKFDRLLELFVKEAAEQWVNVADLKVEVDSSAKTAVITSFAGESRVRLAWVADKVALEGVMAITSLKRNGVGEKEVLNIYLPNSGTAYLPLENGEVLQMNPMRTRDFAYECLMSVVRKQVDLSTEL